MLISIEPKLKEILLETSCGNDDAFRFLCGWHYFCHSVDDIVDENFVSKDRKQFIIDTFLYSKELFSCNFYRQFHRELSSVVDVICNAYADSVSFEHSTEAWQQEMRDIIRFQGNDMLCAVAKICGGYETMRSVSAKLRNLIQEHRDGEKQQKVA